MNTDRLRSVICICHQYEQFFSLARQVAARKRWLSWPSSWSRDIIFMWLDPDLVIRTPMILLQHSWVTFVRKRKRVTDALQVQKKQLFSSQPNSLAHCSAFSFDQPIHLGTLFIALMNRHQESAVVRKKLAAAEKIERVREYQQGSTS